MSEQLLAELLAWTRVNGIAPLKAILAEELRTDNDFAVFNATDGSRGPGDVAKNVGISSRAVSYKWARWRAIGVIFDPPGEDHPRHLVSAADLGLELPKK